MLRQKPKAATTDKNGETWTPAVVTLAVWLRWFVISLTPLNQVSFLMVKRAFWVKMMEKIALIGAGWLFFLTQQRGAVTVAWNGGVWTKYAIQFSRQHLTVKTHAVSQHTGVWCWLKNNLANGSRDTSCLPFWFKIQVSVIVLVIRIECCFIC